MSCAIKIPQVKMHWKMLLLYSPVQGREKWFLTRRANKKNQKGSKEKKDGQINDDGMNRPAYINISLPTSKFDPVIDVADTSFSPR
eukprot:12234214-Ditylum_brightwellii.AAC.1